MEPPTLKHIFEEKQFLREHPEQVFRLFEGLFRFFLFTRDADGRITSVSSRVASILGHSPEAFLETWRDCLFPHPANESFIQRAELTPETAKQAASYKVVFNHKNCDPVWLEVYELPHIVDGRTEKIYGIGLDLTDRTLLEYQLRLGEKRFREMSQSSPIGIFQVDEDGMITYVNPAWERITGRTIPDSLGRPWWQIIHPGDQETLQKKWSQAQKNETNFEIECRVIRPNDSMIWAKLRSQVLFDDAGKITVATIENIDQQVADREKQKQLIHELLQLKEQLEVATRTDPLTGLPNRRDLNEKLSYERARFERTGRPFTLLIVDIDHFKNINDHYGHDAGDYVLVKVSELFRTSCRKMDHICRWGGEEFFFLLPETTLDNGIIFAEKLRSKLEDTAFNFQGQTIRVTASFGVTSVDSKDKDLEAYIKEADDCLYEAKNTGRNRTAAPKRSRDPG